MVVVTPKTGKTTVRRNAILVEVDAVEAQRQLLGDVPAQVQVELGVRLVVPRDEVARVGADVGGGGGRGGDGGGGRAVSLNYRRLGNVPPSETSHVSMAALLRSGFFAVSARLTVWSTGDTVALSGKDGFKLLRADSNERFNR